MASDPLVSIVLPTYDRATLVRTAVDSVRAQTFADWELLVVDDGSTDGTARLLNALGDPRIRVIGLPHSGHAGRARNVGIRESRARRVAFLDSDDAWTPEKLARQLAVMERRTDARWSYTAVRWIGADGEPAPSPPGSTWSPEDGWVLGRLLAWHAAIATPTVVAERALLLEAGLFDESLRYAHDFELWTRLAQRSPVAVVDEPLALVRRHDGSLWRANGSEPLETMLALADRMCADPALRDHRGACRAMRVRAAVNLANRLGAERRGAAAIGALARVSGDGVGSRAWWTTLAKALVRPLLPVSALRALRRRPSAASPDDRTPSRMSR